MPRRYRTAFSDLDGIYLRRDLLTGKLEERRHGAGIGSWTPGLSPAGQRFAAELGWKGGEPIARDGDDTAGTPEHNRAVRPGESFEDWQARQ